MPFIEIEPDPTDETERFPPNDDPDIDAIMRTLLAFDDDEDRRVAWGERIAADAVARRLDGQSASVILAAVGDVAGFAVRAGHEHALGCHDDDHGPIVSSADVAIALVRWAQKNRCWQ